MILSALIDTWAEFLEANRSPHTTESYYRIVQRFVSTFPGRDSITTIDIKDYITKTALETSKKNANVKLTAIKSFCRWYANQNGGYNPADDVQCFSDKEIQPHKQRVLDADEFKKLIVATESIPYGDIKRDVIRFLAHTGLQSQEFLALTTHNINANHLAVCGKGKKKRMIPLNFAAKEILSHNQDGEYLRFVEFYAGRHELYNTCLQVALKAKVEPFGPQAIRYFFCKELYQAGISIQVISQILGHTSTTVTENICRFLPKPDALGVTDILTGKY